MLPFWPREEKKDIVTDAQLIRYLETAVRRSFWVTKWQALWRQGWSIDRIRSNPNRLDNSIRDKWDFMPERDQPTREQEFPQEQEAPRDQYDWQYGPYTDETLPQYIDYI
jgi:hypothetical protein